MPPKKYWSNKDEEKRLCSQWLEEPLINPETGQSIDRKGPTYASWSRRCKIIGMSGTPTATKKMTWRKCQAWYNNRSVNPDTGREIERGGPTWKWIEKECKVIEEKEITLLGKYYLPDRHGMVPCVVYRGTMYLVRQYQGRKIWGPLNKPAKGIKLCYYSDSWDYRYNHYKPIFVGGPPPRRPKTAPKPGVKNRRVKPKDNPKQVVDNFLNLFL